MPRSIGKVGVVAVGDLKYIYISVTQCYSVVLGMEINKCCIFKCPKRYKCGLGHVCCTCYTSVF